MKRLLNYWNKLRMRQKIMSFIGMVLVILFVSVGFDVWMMRLFMGDLNVIMQDNRDSSEFIRAMEEEQMTLQEYIRHPNESNRSALDSSIEKMETILSEISMDYDYLGEERFARLQSIHNSYNTYAEARNMLLQGPEESENYVDRVYELYSMQSYLRSYVSEYAQLTMDEGAQKYSSSLPLLSVVPVITFGIGLVLLFGTMQLARMMNRSITEPIMKLADASRSIAENEFEIEDVQTGSEDELGELVVAFNKMKYATSEYIRALEERRVALDQLHESELESLEVEKRLEAINLELLKNQINPHFLFNTLNVIGGMANLESAETTEKMIGALSSLFRYNLKTRDAEVLMTQELKAAEDYMYLQQMRFGSRVKYSLECEVDPGTVLIPTYTFQPLLENAIIHGLSPKVEGGTVTLSVKKEDEETLLIRVADTGAGMSQEKLQQLRQELADGTSKSIGMGLGNIYKRVQSMYRTGSMEIESTEGEGCEISIRIPVRRTES